MTDSYPYRISSRTEDVLLLWHRGEGDAKDTLAVDDGGRLLTFAGYQALRKHCALIGHEFMEDEEETVLDLDTVRRWVEHRLPGHMSAGLLLDAWNSLEDLARSVKTAASLPARDAVQDSAYDKLFLFRRNVFATDHGEEAWTAEETAAARELLRAGIGMWEQAVRDSVHVPR
ncbi:hypothetical protein ABT095_38075 [Kitasatospora sp. NPDC002227]|uniref:hypothetical protein n=1 Tax=Kitasatospora sp. NPDC002227 TaxID=3154773 RepID=UPI0033245E20